MIGIVILLTGSLVLYKSFRDYGVFKRPKPVATYTGMVKQFKIEESSTYAVTVEGTNFDQFKEGQIIVRDAFKKEDLNVTMTNLSHSYRPVRAYYADIAKFFAAKGQLIELDIKDYDQMRTYLSRYKVVEKYAQDRPPEIKVFKFVSSQDRILALIFFVVGFMVTALGLGLVILNITG
ncbi:MAG: hypothetical protein AAF466_08370 [Bacteroidota bacterium]